LKIIWHTVRCDYNASVMKNTRLAAIVTTPLEIGKKSMLLIYLVVNIDHSV